MNILTIFLVALQASATTPVTDECFICEFTGFAATEDDALDMLSGKEALTSGTGGDGLPASTV